jgi:hypothetical protein
VAEEQGRPPRGGLSRYVLAATLARISDGGAIVAVVLLVNTSGGSPAAAGLLGACVTAPHLFGPFVARRLDTAADGRRVIAAACVIHALTLTAALLTYGHPPVLVPAVLLAASGLVGPFLTGGISSRLPSIAGPDVRQQRRAQGWDVATYGLAGTLGPTLVAVLAGVASARAAGLVLAAGALTAGLVVGLLPYQPRPARTAEVPRPLATLTLMLTSGKLRRTLVLTVVVALGVAVLPISAVASADLYGIPASATGALVAAYGLGNLTGALAVMMRPLSGEADHLTRRLAGVVALGLLIVLIAPAFWMALLAYGATGVANSYFFASTLAARSEYAPAEARLQVFVWVGALKITAGSAGTAGAGAAAGAGPVVPVAAAICGLALAATLAWGDARSSTRPARRP